MDIHLFKMGELFVPLYPAYPMTYNLSNILPTIVIKKYNDFRSVRIGLFDCLKLTDNRDKSTRL